MPKTKSTYSEIDDIREDLDSLKNNVVELTQHLRRDGSVRSQELRSAIMDQFALFQQSGRDQYKNVEKRIKAQPGKSIAIAFAAGLAASLLLRRR